MNAEPPELTFLRDRGGHLVPLQVDGWLLMVEVVAIHACRREAMFLDEDCVEIELVDSKTSSAKVCRELTLVAS